MISKSLRIILRQKKAKFDSPSYLVYTFLDIAFHLVPTLFVREPVWYAFPREERGNEKARTVKSVNCFYANKMKDAQLLTINR